MSPDTELVLLFGSLHLIAILFGVGLFVMFLRSEPVREWLPDDEDGDGGSGTGTPPVPKPGPSGDGLPLPDAMPARVRLREPARLAERIPRPERRPAREPQRAPVRR